MQCPANGACTGDDSSQRNGQGEQPWNDVGHVQAHPPGHVDNGLSTQQESQAACGSHQPGHGCDVDALAQRAVGRQLAEPVVSSTSAKDLVVKTILYHHEL